MSPNAIQPIDPAQQKLLLDNPVLLERIGRGIEKESLRVGADGRLARTPHPRALGSPLTHPNITTDFSEAQLEFITAVHRTPEACIAQLMDIHRFVYANLDDEILWPTSMPCILGADQEIPIGHYGRSNIGRAKSIYRRGLVNRYGALMQTISGIHYNFSMPEAFWPLLAAQRGTTADKAFRTDAYFGLIRNFRRYSWLLLYLFGASPAVCKTFVQNLPTHSLENFDEHTLYLPYATSLRMGRLGYQSDAQAQLHISYNSLNQYDRTMTAGLTTDYPPYEAVGVKVGSNYEQLSSALLQIENEFYGTIRPKQPVRSGERPLTALRRAGVAYVEVRCMDLDPHLPAGIDSQTSSFLDMFLLFCLLAPSPPDSPEETQRIQENQLRVVERGREPGLMLKTDTGPVALSELAQQLIWACAPLAPMLDEANRSQGYSAAWEVQRLKVDNAQLTPAAKILSAMAEANQPFFRFAMQKAKDHEEFFHGWPLNAEQLAANSLRVSQSHQRQLDIEAADTLPFDDFLTDYLALE